MRNTRNDPKVNKYNSYQPTNQPTNKLTCDTSGTEYRLEFFNLSQVGCMDLVLIRFRYSIILVEDYVFDAYRPKILNVDAVEAICAYMRAEDARTQKDLAKV